MSTPPKAVLDASAIVALVFHERGHDVIQQIIRAGFATTTPTGLAEALNTCRRKGYRGTRDEILNDVSELGLKVTPLIEEDAEEVAFLLERAEEIATKGGEHAEKIGTLSLGDAVCLAVAARLDAIAVVSDGTWELLDVRGLRVQPFR